MDMFYRSGNARAVFDKALGLTAELTFTITADDLAETDLVRAFQHNFEDAAFASFAIGGLTSHLRQLLKSCGDGITGLLDPYGDRLLACPDMRSALPELAIGQVNGVLPPEGGAFEVVDPLMLEGRLASALHHGGAYRHVSAADAVDAARDFCRRFFADRYDDVFVLSGPGWSEWWHQVTGDYAWIMTDLGASKVHLLCASGAD